MLSVLFRLAKSVMQLSHLKRARACASLLLLARAGLVESRARAVARSVCFQSVCLQCSGTMFVSVWYAKKMGRRFINNVRKAKKQRHRIMVGNYAFINTVI